MSRRAESARRVRPAVPGAEGKRGRAAPLRIGVFGGTFDPPHLGHLAIAEAAREELRLDRVLFVPAGTPPHKRGRRISPAPDRVAMTRIAIRGNGAFRVSTIEVARRGASYTVETLATLARAHPGARLYLIMGEDGLEEFHTWRDPEGILALARLAVARRNRAKGSSPARGDGGRGFRRRVARRVVWLGSPLLEVSSSSIRERAARGRSIRYLVPPAVAARVARHRLYGRKA